MSPGAVAGMVPQTREQATAELDRLSRSLALKAVLSDLLDVHKGLPVGDAKKDGLTYAIGNVSKHLARLGADPGLEGGEGV